MPEARLLVIDDEPNIRDTLRLALEAAGYHVTTAEDGPHGLELFGTGGGWDLVLLDHRLPRGRVQKCSAACIRRTAPCR